MEWDVLVFSPLPWEWQSHRPVLRSVAPAMARQLQGRSRIFWVEPPAFPVSRRLGEVGRATRKLTAPRHFEGEGGVIVYSPFVAVPRRLAVRHSTLLELNRLILRRQITGFLAGVGSQGRSIISFFSWPETWWCRGLAGETLSVYYCLDNFAAARSGREQEAMRKAEARFLSQVDLVLAVSKGLASTKAQHHPRVFYLPNGVDFDHFARAVEASTPIAQEVRTLPRPIVGYVGNMETIDLPLIAALASSRPDWTFVLIGALPHYLPEMMQQIEAVKFFKNVQFLGSRPYGLLPSYAKAFDVCIIPYTRSDFDLTRSPLKMYEYLAAGKPVVTCDIPEVQQFGQLMRVARTPQEFEEAIEACLREPDISRDRMRVAADNSWSARASQLIGIIEAALGRRFCNEAKLAWRRESARRA